MPSKSVTLATLASSGAYSSDPAKLAPPVSHDYPFHPLCAMFPLMSDVEQADLADDIKKNGLRIPILLYDHKIIDGRNRYLACRIANVQPVFDSYSGANPKSLVAGLNLKRRHLTDSQKAFFAAELANLLPGQKKQLGAQALAQKDAAKVVGTSVDSLKRAKTVITHGTRKLINQVKKGRVDVKAAAKVAKLPKSQQNSLADQGPNAIKKKARELSQDLPPKPIDFTPLLSLLNSAIDDFYQKSGDHFDDSQLEIISLLKPLIQSIILSWLPA